MIPKLKIKLGISHQEAMKKAAEEWNKMSGDDKKPYVEQHDKDQKR